MKFTAVSYLVCLVSLCSMLTEIFAAPTPLSLDIESDLEIRGDAVKENYDKFLKYLKSSEGQKNQNICFYSGRTGGVGVFTKLPDLAKKTGCEYMDTVRVKAKVDKDISMKFSNAQWKEISRQLANNARGKAKVLLGEELPPTAIWLQDELPILQASMKKKLVSGIEQWNVDKKQQLVGPMAYKSKI